MSNDRDLELMREALEEAKKAAAEDETPIGALLTLDGQIVARGHNQPRAASDPTAHAEMIVIREAASKLGERLPRTTLYVTLEPCVMCIGAIINARIAHLRYGARDEKAGALGSVYDIGRDGRLNHRVEVRGEIMAEECRRILQEFFRGKRS